MSLYKLLLAVRTLAALLTALQLAACSAAASGQGRRRHRQRSRAPRRHHRRRPALHLLPLGQQSAQAHPLPAYSPDGTTLTRGNPPLPGERTDHPHHTGLWFNYSNVNNIDYWNNSDAIKPEARARYGSIDHDRIVSAKSGATSGELVTESTWYPSSDVPSVGSNQQPPVIHQTTRYVFSKITIDGKPARAIDMTVTLKALAHRRLPR